MALKMELPSRGESSVLDLGKISPYSFSCKISSCNTDGIITNLKPCNELSNNEDFKKRLGVLAGQQEEIETRKLLGGKICSPNNVLGLRDHQQIYGSGFFSS
jgi:hypothetical protein